MQVLLLQSRGTSNPQAKGNLMGGSEAYLNKQRHRGSQYWQSIAYLV